MPTQKRTLSIILVLCLSLVLLLTACSSVGTASPSDTTTPEVSDTQTPDNTPSGTETPSNTPGTTAPADVTTDPSITTDIPKDQVVLLPDPENISDEYLKHISEDTLTIGSLGGPEAVDNYLDEIYEEYGIYLNENISKNCVKIGIFSILSIDAPVAGITPEALENVNKLLNENGKKPLGQQAPKEKIAALWIAASLYYDADYNEYDNVSDDFPGWRFDIGHAFAMSKYTDQETIKSYEQLYSSDYANLFNIF